MALSTMPMLKIQSHHADIQNKHYIPAKKEQRRPPLLQDSQKSFFFRLFFENNV